MSWASILAGALKLLNALADYLSRKQLLDAGAAQQRADDADDTNDRLKAGTHRANAVRRDPDSVPDDKWRL